MRKIALISGVALALALTSQAMAQQGGGQRGGGQSPAQPRPTSGAASPLSPAQQLNQGNYVDAQGIANLAGNARTITREYLERGISQTASGGLISEEIARFTGIPGDYTQVVTDVRQLAGAYQNTRLPAPPASSPGSRPLSSLEVSQTEGIYQWQGATQQQVDVARELVTAARQTNNTELLARAQGMLSQAETRLADINNVLAYSNAYQGRAFANDEEAMHYLVERNRVLTDASEQRRLQTLDMSRTYNGEYEAFYQELRAAYDGTDTRLGGRADQVSPAQRTRVEDAISRSKVETQGAGYVASAAQHSLSTPEDRNAVRQSYHDTTTGAVDQVAQRQVIEARSGQRLPMGGGRSETSTAGGGARDSAAEAAANSTDGNRSAAAGADASARTAQAEDNTPPRPVPTEPDYPTVSAEERARIHRDAEARRQAQQEAANAASAAERARAEA
ncbi:MAG: hypothetical protein QM676_10520, partial [Novosphingobium sp.]